MINWKRIRFKKEYPLKTLFLCFVVFFTSLLVADDLTGFWQTVDKKTRQPSSVVAIYPYQGKYYGRIIATCTKGVVTETIYHPQSRAPGVVGNPYYCGLDFIWACVPESRGRYKGHVMDPRDGNTYNAKIWKEKGNLILRGEVLMFGKNETLVQFPSQNFNDNFAPPDLSTFIPVSNKTKHQTVRDLFSKVKQLASKDQRD